MHTVETYQVLEGMIVGHDSAIAMTTDEQLQADGWYYFKPMADNGTGPFGTKERAEAAARECPITAQQIWLALAEGKFKLLPDDGSFQGIEYDGWGWDPTDEDYQVTVVMDLTPGGPKFQVIRTDDNGETESWVFEADLAQTQGTR